jgi:hypothetical protein
MLNKYGSIFMKKDKSSVNSSRYFEIINKTKSCIVINSCNLVLKPKGESGDSIVVDESKTMDNDVIGLKSAGLIEIVTPRVKTTAKSKKDRLAINSNVVEKKQKISVNDKKGSKVVYIDHGKVKKGKMTRSIQDLRIIDPSGNNDNAEGNNDKHSDAFIDTANS